MKVWQPINTVPLDTPVIVTDGRIRRLATLRTQKPVWDFATAEPAPGLAGSNLNSQTVYAFCPTHWFALPKLPVKA